ncbi:hypothetical protein M407DRAFT_214358 [Tulasnella calospora MUT 4182]|uniref:F-box domain-containing protein n=1 Tax=Tulasnella calospora MUT 4182 TaxID=1051891 RepID=A0A0C3QV17_9AGAM|nr:hypothetical protein M407DRAFT_214358 [Tulasnella calospora MUT 4182]
MKTSHLAELRNSQAAVAPEALAAMLSKRESIIALFPKLLEKSIYTDGWTQIGYKSLGQRRCWLKTVTWLLAAQKPAAGTLDEWWNAWSGWSRAPRGADVPVCIAALARPAIDGFQRIKVMSGQTNETLSVEDDSRRIESLGHRWIWGSMESAVGDQARSSPRTRPDCLSFAIHQRSLSTSMAGKKRRTSTTTTKTSVAVEMRSTKKTRADPLAVPELLTNVLSFATHSTLASCALVCKQWSEVALARLWRHLESVFPLLELVMDLELPRNWELNVPDALQTLSSKLSKTDWSRFQYYSGRIRSLTYNYRKNYRPNSTTPGLAPEAIAMLCLHLPSRLDVFPHLETLSWATDGSVAPILPFLTPQVKSLDVELMGDSQSVDDFFHALAGRTPNLETFTLKTIIPAIDVEASLLKTISTWKTLKTLTVPPHYLRPSIMNAVASLPNLTLLDQQYTHHPPYDEVAMLQELPKNAFPKLQIFGFNSNPVFAQRLVQNHPALFTKLTDIIIDSSSGVSEEEVSGLAHHLGRECTGLVRISLNFCLGLIPQTEETSPLSFRVLESLFPCRKLKMLEIGHPYPLTINEMDVERMAAAWPNMEVFNVGNEPDLSLPIPGDMGNSFSILSTFARHFPEMETLGLFFAKDQSLRFSGDLYPEFEFHRLESLSVGVSAVPGGCSQETGFLIASLCMVLPTIELGVSNWYVGTECSEWAEYRRQWEETDKSLELAMRTKIASRAKPSRAQS